MPTPVEVKLAAAPHHREDAVRAAGALLVQAGFAQAPYVDSLLQRERVHTTYLGQGVAIPHGMVEDKHLVTQTGLAVLQVPGGVAWGHDADGQPQTAHLVVAIAAASDQHIEVLRRLTRLMRDGTRIAQLVSTTDATEIVRALTGDDTAPAGRHPPTEAEDFALGIELSLNYPNGLHARPAGQWAQTLQRFAATVHVRHGDTVADARSVAALLSLGAGRGARLRLSAQGADAQAALNALRDTLTRLGEEETRQAELAAARQAQAQGLGRELGDWQPEARQTFTGIAASPGLVIGTLVAAEAGKLEVDDRPPGQPIDIAREAAALDAALTGAHHQLQALVAAARQRGASDQAAIFGAHLELLGDTALLREVSRSVVQGHGAAWAWKHHLAERVAAQQALKDPTLAARAADLQDAGDRVLRHLLGRGDEAAGARDLPDDAILIADDLAPSVTAQIDTRKVRGFCTARGGPTAHTAILARSLGLPAVVATGPGVLQALEPALNPHGTLAILDGYRGRLYLAPSECALVQARAMIARLAARQAQEAQGRLQPATTTDGQHIEVAANVNRADQVPPALEAGAEGVGLMRTEFLFLERDHVPGEDEQYAVYRAMVEALQGRPLIVRTLDIGGDKQVPHLALPVEDNPFLGVRGARLCLRRDDLLVPQIRALYRAAQHGPLAIMFPMISTVEEVTAAARAPGGGAGRGGRAGAAHRHHDRGALGRADGRPAGRARGLLFHRHQRPHPVHPGRGPPAPRAGRHGRQPAPRGAAPDRAHGGGRPPAWPLGGCVWWPGRRTAGRSPAGGPGRERAEHEHQRHHRHQGPAAPPFAGRAAGPGPPGAGLRHRRRGACPGPGVARRRGAGMTKVITITLNPAIDQTVRLDSLVPGAVHRALGQQSEAGGKGVGVAAVLAALNVPVAASGWLGADNDGIFRAAFAQRGIADHMLRLPGSTRTNIKLAVAQRGDTTDINLPGLQLDPTAQAGAEAQLIVALQSLVRAGDWCELAGSLPPGVGPATWLHIAQAVLARGAELVIDTGGAVLGELLRALKAAGSPLPALIKPNRAELEELAGRALPTVADVADAAAALQAQGVTRVVVSLGGDGAVIVDARGRWFASPPKVPVATTVGAGDALVAGTLAALVQGQAFPEAAVFGMACAAARIQRIAPGLPPRPEIDALAAGIRVSAL